MAIDPSDIPSTGGDWCAATAVAGYPIDNPAVNETRRRFEDVIRDPCRCARNLRSTGRSHDTFRTPSPQIPCGDAGTETCRKHAAYNMPGSSHRLCREPRKEHPMKLPISLTMGLAAACGAAQATEYGTVISSTAVTAQVAVPLQQCSEQQVLVQPRTSGGGAVLGALVGGVVGHQVGGGFGRAAATGLGVVAGSVIGDRTEAANTPATTVPVQNCQTLTSYENRVVGYDVTYEYHGQRYVTRVAQDPGPRIALNVTVAPAGATVATVPAAPLPMPVAPLAPPVVYTPVSAYGYYGPYGYYDYYGGYYGGPAVTVVPRVVIGGHRRHGY
jgi:uncharacterized protein YcfJ